MRDRSSLCAAIDGHTSSPRQIAMYIARQLTGSMPIGHEFDCRHHTTVLHSIQQDRAMRRSDEALNRMITQLVKCRRSALGESRLNGSAVC